MFWDWRQGRPHRREVDTNDPQIRLFQGSNIHNKVAKRGQLLHKSSHTLGVFQTPLGDFSDHIMVLQKKANQYASHLRSPRLTQNDIKVFHRSVYSPAMRYSLPALAINEEELECVQSKIIPTIVQQLGFSSKMATAIRYGPTSMGGLNLMDLRTECGIEMIKYVRHEVYGNTNVCQLLLLQVQASQLESGLPINLLEEPTVHIPCLTPTCILSIWQFMSNHNIQITVTDPYHIHLKGSNDQYIMDLNRLKGYSTPQQQKDINLARLHLQSTTLLDLVDRSDDTKIAKWALECSATAGLSRGRVMAKATGPGGIDETHLA